MKIWNCQFLQPNGQNKIPRLTNKENIRLKEAILQLRQRDLLRAGRGTAALILEMILLNIVCRKGTIVLKYYTNRPHLWPR